MHRITHGEIAGTCVVPPFKTSQGFRDWQIVSGESRNGWTAKSENAALGMVLQQRALIVVGPGNHLPLAERSDGFVAEAIAEYRIDGDVDALEQLQDEWALPGLQIFGRLPAAGVAHALAGDCAALVENQLAESGVKLG